MANAPDKLFVGTRTKTKGRAYRDGSESRVQGNWIRAKKHKRPESALMGELDFSLIYRPRKFITGENVHKVKTWLFCYETSAPRSKRRKQYQRLLYQFVTSRSLVVSVRIDEQIQRTMCEGV